MTEPQGGTGDAQQAGANQQQSQQQGDNGGQGNGFTPPASQADLDRIIGERLQRERAKYADYDDLRTKLNEFEQQGMSEAQKAAERAKAAEQQAGTAQAELTKVQVALQHGFVIQDKEGRFTVDTDALSLLGSGTEDELKARAQQIVSLRGQRAQQQQPFNHGAGGQAPAGDMNSLIFGQLRK